MIKGWRPWEFGESPPKSAANAYTQDNKLCAFPGCVKNKRKSGGSLCGGHQKQKDRRQELRPLKPKGGGKCNTSGCEAPIHRQKSGRSTGQCYTHHLMRERILKRASYQRRKHASDRRD